jgi:hypothetical protein
MAEVVGFLGEQESRPGIDEPVGELVCGPGAFAYE